jgi:hypothetical protein
MLRTTRLEPFPSALSVNRPARHIRMIKGNPAAPFLYIKSANLLARHTLTLKTARPAPYLFGL